MVERCGSSSIREVIGSGHDVEFSGLDCRIQLVDSAPICEYRVEIVADITKTGLKRHVQFLVCDGGVLEWERSVDYVCADNDLEKCSSAQSIIAAMPLPVIARVERIIISAALNHAIEKKLWNVSAVAMSTLYVQESDEFIFLYVPALFAVSEAFRLTDVVTNATIDFDKLHAILRTLRGNDG